MKKKTMVSIVASSLLIAPIVLHQVVAADEQTGELIPATEVIHAPYTGVSPTASDTNTSSSEEGTRSSEASTEKVVPAPESPAVPSEATVPAAASSDTNREVTPPSAASSETPVTGQDLAKVTGSTVTSDQASKELTVQDAVNGVLQWAATDPSQLG